MKQKKNHLKQERNNQIFKREIKVQEIEKNHLKQEKGNQILK